MNETLKRMADMLEARWNSTDEELIKQYREFCEAHSGERFDIGWGRKVTAHDKFTHNLTAAEQKAISYGKSWAFSQNAKQAQAFVKNLETRVKAITGEITDWQESETEQSTYSYIVIGEKGKAKVSQIYAGGYNIVRLHVRNIIKAI